MYVLHLKKIEVSISLDSTDTVNRTIKFFLITLYKSITFQGIIPRRVNKNSAKTWLPGEWYPRVWYPGESWKIIVHKISLGLHTPASQFPRGCIPRQVSLPGVSYCSESISPGYMTLVSHSWPIGVNSHFLKLLHRPLKGQFHENKCGCLFNYFKGLHFVFIQKRSFFLLPGVWYHADSVFATKIWITQHKLNQNKKYYNPLFSGPSWFELWKNRRSKISLDGPFKPVRTCSDAPINSH